jgi:hypothetical protein
MAYLNPVRSWSFSDLVKYDARMGNKSYHIKKVDVKLVNWN